ncbi:hypothetical protein, partial [Paenibacillus phytohabitans]
RLYETNHQDTVSHLEFPLWKRNVTLNFGRSEVKTIFIPFDERSPVFETNLLEDKLGEVHE